MLQFEGRKVLMDAKQEMERGKVPGRKMVDGLLFCRRIPVIDSWLCNGPDRIYVGISVNPSRLSPLLLGLAGEKDEEWQHYLLSPSEVREGLG